MGAPGGERVKRPRQCGAEGSEGVGGLHNVLLCKSESEGRLGGHEPAFYLQVLVPDKAMFDNGHYQTCRAKRPP